MDPNLFWLNLESIFHTFVNTPKEYRTSAYNNAINIIGDSVIRTSLLPVVADEFIYDFDVSGLGGGISEKVERDIKSSIVKQIV